MELFLIITYKISIQVTMYTDQTFWKIRQIHSITKLLQISNVWVSGKGEEDGVREIPGGKQSVTLKVHSRGKNMSASTFLLLRPTADLKPTQLRVTANQKDWHLLLSNLIWTISASLIEFAPRPQRQKGTAVLSYSRRFTFRPPWYSQFVHSASSSLNILSNQFQLVIVIGV